MIFLPLSLKLRFIAVIFLLSFMDLKPMSNLHKPRTKRSGENSKGIWTNKGKSVFGTPVSGGEGSLNRHELAKYESRIDDAGSTHDRRGLVIFPNNGSSSSGGFGNVDSLKFPPTKFIPDTFLSPFYLPPAESGVQDQLKTTQVDVPKLNYEDALAEYPFVPEPVFPTDVSETEPYYPVYEPPQTLFPCEWLPFEEGFIKDSDYWILDFMSDPSFNTKK